MRPASIAARMSRSERTTATEYAGLRLDQRAHRGAELAPGANGLIGVRQWRTREAPEDLDAVRAGGLPHRDVGRAVADHHRFMRRDAETAHGVLREVRRGLRARRRIAPEIDVDVLLDPEAAEDPLAVVRALACDRRLQQPGGVEIAERRSRAAVQARRRDRHRSEEHTSELQSHVNLVCRLLLEKKKKITYLTIFYNKKNHEIISL